LVPDITVLDRINVVSDRRTALDISDDVAVPDDTLVYIVRDGRSVPHIYPDDTGIVPDGMGVEIDGRRVPHISGEVTGPVSDYTVVHVPDSINVVPVGRTALDTPREVAVPDGGLIMLAIERKLNPEIWSCLYSSDILLSAPSNSASIWFNIGVL
jgi:hypothetical protein